ncbi:unnamed protein product [Calypogeia fissa]
MAPLQVQVREFIAAVMVLGTVVSMAMTSAHAQINLNPSCPITGIANFGDSLTDTGNAADTDLITASENPPYGEYFFGQPAKRFGNGRLVNDFFSMGLKWPLPEPYFSVPSFNYKFGVNFAEAGAPVALNLTAANLFSVVPYQIDQFIRFQNSVISAQSQPLACFNFDLFLPKGSPSTTLQTPFSTWLYTITAGSNDLFPPFEQGVPTSYINDTLVPRAVNATVFAINALYQRGARQFLIFGLYAGGCSTIVLTALGTRGPFTKDSMNCSADVNNVVQHFNTLLLSEIKSLRGSLLGASLAYFDYYDANIAILSNAETLGFNATLTLTTCCGAPGVGTLNYNPNLRCGQPDSNNCANPDQYINWDGIHFTEAFNRYIAYFALNGIFTDGAIDFSPCNLDYSKWGRDVTFQQAYPPLVTCNNIFS